MSEIKIHQESKENIVDETCTICPNAVDRKFSVHVSSYYGCCVRTPVLFCSENCKNEYIKTHRCQICHRTEELSIAENGFSYCTVRLHDDDYLTCYDSQLDIDSQKINTFMEMYVEKTRDFVLHLNDFSKEEITVLTSAIGHCLCRQQGKTYRCEYCGGNNQLKIANNDLAYCTGKTYEWNESCYDKYLKTVKYDEMTQCHEISQSVIYEVTEKLDQLALLDELNFIELKALKMIMNQKIDEKLFS